MGYSKYNGMTVNERLFEAGLLNKFDLAVQKKNVEQVVQILRQVQVDESDIDAIIKKLHVTNTETLWSKIIKYFQGIFK